jgi:hypothetical protein
VIELNAEGTDYLVRTDAGGGVLVSTWPELLYILRNARDRLHQQTILERWPEDRNPPDRSTLLRRLTRATRQGLIRRAGTGHRGDAFRYWLPDHEPLLWPGDRASKEEKEAWRERRTAYARGLYNPAGLT